MARKGLIYFIFSENKRPLYIDAAGHVAEGNDNYLKPDQQPANLKRDPNGWKDTNVKYARNLKWWGVFRDMATGMFFSGDGAQILMYLNWRQGGGVETTAYLGLARLNKLALPYTYEAWYMSELNFSKYNEKRDGVQIEALEGGPAKWLKANESTEYTFDIEQDAEHISTLMDGMELDNVVEYFVDNGFSETAFYDFGNHLVALQVISREVDRLGGAQDQFRFKVANNNAAILAANDNAMNITTAGVVKCEWNFTLQIEFTPPAPALNPAAEVFSLIRVIDKTGTTVQTVNMLHRVAAAGIPGIYNLAGNANVNVQEGDVIVVYTFCTVAGAGGDAQLRFTYSGDSPFMKFTYTYRAPASVVPGYTPYVLAQRLVDRLTDGRYTLKSAYLAAMDDIMITSGDALRGLLGAQLKTSLSKFFQALGIRAIGMGVEGDTVVIENIEYFFQNSVITDIGELSEAELTPAENIMGNKIKVGGPLEDYEEINGKYETNQGQNWMLPITKIIREIDLTNPYRTDAIGIELIRQNLSDKKTTDATSDNDVFMINVKPEFSAFKATLTFDSVLSNILISGAHDKLSSFGAKVRFKITGTLLNDGVYSNTNTQDADPDFFVFPRELVQDEAAVLATIQVLQYTLNRPAYTAVTGIPHPSSAFNLEFRPKNTILNNGALLHSLLYLMDAKKIRISSWDKNINLVTTISGKTITEREPISIGSLPKPLFLPYYIRGKTKAPINLLAIMKANPYGLIRFTWRNRTYTAFMNDGGIKNPVDETQEWVMIAGPDNDLSKFNKP